MKTFFRSFLGSLAAVMVAGIILMFIFFAMLFGSIAGGGASLFGGGDKECKVKENSVLYVKFENPIVDRANEDPFSDFDFFTFSSHKPMGLNSILESIERAGKDERIKGIYLDVSFIPAGFATVEEIRNALLDFKESGKWLIAYSEVYTQNTYYLASVADEIYLYPEGMLDFRGLATGLAFFKGSLEKLDIEAQVIRPRNNRFKSAVEPFIYDKMSDANREQINRFLGSMWDNVVKGISEARSISVEELNRIADSMDVRKPEYAVEHKMVDQLAYKDDILALLREKLEIDEDEDINTVKLRKYFHAKLPDEKEKKKEDEQENIAVIYAEGGVVSGKGDGDNFGSEPVSKAIREARLDSTVKAIVFRVNSPGGSALASDVIWREVTLAQKEKPVVVSMGNLAASGGYYISCAADKIFAGPNTITGSIGVFGVLPNFGNFYKNKLGITFDWAKTNNYGDFGDVTRQLKGSEHEIIQEWIDDIYDDFLGKVADGRGMSKADVDSIAQGRVWSGTDALKLGLVDELGGLNDAIAAAAELAKLEDYEVLELPKKKDPFEEFIMELVGEAQAGLVKTELGSSYKYYEQLKWVAEMEGVQMRLPFIIEVR